MPDKDMYPDEALEETAAWQRAHLPRKEWWHPDLTALVGDCCGAPVEEHRPEDTHARCTACGEMAVIDKVRKGAIHPQAVRCRP